MFFPLGRCTLYTKTKHQDQQMECQAASATHETLALEHAKQLCGKIEMLRTYCLPSTSRLYTCLYVRRYLTLPYLYLPCALGMQQRGRYICIGRDAEREMPSKKARSTKDQADSMDMDGSSLPTGCG